MGSQGGILSVKSPHKSSNLVEFPLKYSIEGQILNNSREKEVLTWLANIQNIKSPLFLSKPLGIYPPYCAQIIPVSFSFGLILPDST
jgi:hypothetical protein